MEDKVKRIAKETQDVLKGITLLGFLDDYLGIFRPQDLI